MDFNDSIISILLKFQSNIRFLNYILPFQTNFFKSFQPFFVHVRLKFHNPGIVRWLKAIIIYLEQLFSILEISLPSSHYLVQLNRTAMNYIQSVAYFLVWIFGTESYLFDQIIVLIVHILFLVFLIMTAKGFQTKKAVSYWSIFTIYIYLYYYNPVFIFGFFFRISDTIENLISHSGAKFWISFVVEIINYFFFVFYTYIDSLFLESFSFVSTCYLDTYDGKGTLVLFFAQTYMCICSNLINLLTAKYIDIIFVILALGFAFLVIFYRFLLISHVTTIGDYLEISNIISFPFVLLIHRFVPGSNWIVFYFVLVFHVFLIVCIIAVKKLKIRRARKISIIMLQNSDNNNLPQVVSDSFVSTIRILVKINANPIVFERLLQQYQQVGLKSSIVLEIVRFLGVFPEKRKNMILLLRTLNSKTNYNIFMTYLFHKTLASLIRNSTEENLQYFTDLKRQFLVHQSLFWIRRSQRLYFKSLKEAFSVAYYYIELKTEIASLIKRFPYDSSIYIQYGEFILFASGDFDLYIRCNEIASELKIHKYAIEDPLLHPMLNFSPRIMQFCKVNKKIKNYDSNFLDFTTNNNTTNLNLNPNGSSSTVLDTRLSSIRKNESGTDDSFLNLIKVPSLITPSKRNIPFWPIYNIVLVFVFFFIFFGSEISFENVITNESDIISNKLNQDVNLITEITANCIITIATNHYLMSNFSFYYGNAVFEKGNAILNRKRFFYNNNNSDFIFVNNDRIYTNLNYYDKVSINSKKMNSSLIKNILKSKKVILNEFYDDNCYEEIKLIISSSYELLDDWTQLSYASQMLSDALCKFFYYSIYSKEQICTVINSITSYIENVTINEFDKIEKSIQEINDDISGLDHHIKYKYKIYLFVGISVGYSFVFILIYIFIIVMQVNSVFKDDEIAIKFLSSRERLSLLLLEQTEKSWQLLLHYVNENEALQNMKIDSNTGIGIQAQKSSFTEVTPTNTANTTRNNTRNNTPNNTVNNTHTNTPNNTVNNTHTNTSNNTVNNNEASNSKIMASSSLIVTRSELNIPLNDDKQNNLSLSPLNSPSASLDAPEGPTLMMLPKVGRTSVTFTGYPTQLFKSTNDFMIKNKNFNRNRFALSEGQSETDNDDRNQAGSKTFSSFNRMYNKTESSIDAVEKEEQIIEIDPIDGIIKNSLRKSRNKWIYIIFLLFSSWLVLILSMVLFIIPLNLRSKHQIETSSTMLNLSNQINSFFHITELIYYSIIHFDNLTYNEIEGIQESIAKYHDEITSSKSILTDLYTKEQCLMLQGVTCTSAARIVFRFMRDPSFSTTEEDIESAVHLYIPACLFFSKQLLTDILYNDLIELTNRRYSVDYCFLVLIVLFFLVCLHLSLLIQKLLNEGFNSLFHYPEPLLKKNLNEKDENKKNKKNNNSILYEKDNQSNESFPSSILVVSYVAETDEIYSISDNSQSILQRPPQEFISRKFSQTFPLISDSDSLPPDSHHQKETITEIREHLMPDKKNKKTFRTSSTKMDHIIKIVMIEETKQNSVLFIPKNQQNENASTNTTAVSSASNLLNNTGKTESLANKLTFFVPSTFAKSFNDENVSSVNYSKCIVIMIRIKNNVTFQAHEKFFSILNSQVSNYSSINIMKIDGSIVILSTVSETQPIIPFLFVRDILNDNKNFAKNKPELFVPECFLLTKSLFASGEMKEGIEPFLEFDMPNYLQIEKLFYSLKNESCFFFDDLLDEFQGFKEICTKCENQIEDEKLSSIQFPNYISYFSNHM